MNNTTIRGYVTRACQAIIAGDLSLARSEMAGTDYLSDAEGRAINSALNEAERRYPNIPAIWDMQWYDFVG
jgi:hypothetical protein